MGKKNPSILVRAREILEERLTLGKIKYSWGRGAMQVLFEIQQ